MNRNLSTASGLNAGGALLARLKALGIDHVFVNSGTDFPPLIEGLAEATAAGIALPRPIMVAHEHAAMGLAHGAWLATGRPQAVMLHTSVGLANAAIGAINAATDRVPVIIMSGRTPTTEHGRFGARTVPIGWGQEMRDQAALVREACKWEYELRFPEQVGEVLDRAWAIAGSTPTGPVYLSLPREVLCEPHGGVDLAAAPSMAPVRLGLGGEDIARAADMLAAARRPVIFAQRGAGSQAGFGALTALAADWAIPVCQYWAVALALASGHEMNGGDDPARWIGEADAILVIDSLAPWSPDIHRPAADARVVHLGPDPLFVRTPVRNFRSDLSIACETGDGLVALEAAMRPHLAEAGATIAERREWVAARRPSDAGVGIEANAGLTKAVVGRALCDAVWGHRPVVLSELGVPFSSLDLDTHDAWRQEPQSGGLGWSLPAAMGIQLNDPDRLVVATMGDGSYLFANPPACHQAMVSQGLPVLAVVVNNGGYAAVRQSVAGLYPDGAAARMNEVPLTGFDAMPDLVALAGASGIRGWRVEDAAGLAGALREAVRRVREDRKPALVDVRVVD